LAKNSEWPSLGHQYLMYFYFRIKFGQFSIIFLSLSPFVPAGH